MYMPEIRCRAASDHLAHLLYQPLQVCVWGGGLVKLTALKENLVDTALLINAIKHILNKFVCMSHTQLKQFYSTGHFFEIRFLLIIDLIHVDSARTKLSTETPANRSI